MDDPQLTERRLTLALWFVNHKLILRRILIIVLAVMIAGFWSYAIVVVVADLFKLTSRRAAEQELLSSGAALTAYVKGTAPQEIRVGELETLASGQVTDVIARLQNPNAFWRAKFRYTVKLGEAQADIREAFLLPGEQRIFFNSFRGAVGAPDFQIEKVSWFRIDSREAPDLAAFRQERLQFDVQNAAFVSDQISRGAADRVTFAITNKTAYGYFEPKFLVLLYRGERLVGVQSTILDQFKSGETRNVELSWFDRVGAVSRIEIIPEIDIFDPAVYIEPAGE